MKRLRLTWVATHPSQYLAPFLRHVASACPELEVTALYASVPSPAQHGRDFAIDVDWGVPLLDGYRSVVMRASRPDDVFSYDKLRGIDVAGVTEAIRATNPDLVLAPGWHSMFLLRAIAAARRLDVPLMYRGDSHLDSSGKGGRRMLAHLRARWLLGRFTSGLAVGQRARAYLLAMGVPEDRVFDVPHCVDNAFFESGVETARRRGVAVLRQEFGLPQDAFTILFAGKLVAHKKVDDLIAAVSRLSHPAVLHVVGSGAEEARYREAAARAGIQAMFSGFLDQRAILRAYASADCLVLPSRETWGMVCNEALASGVPVVVSDAVGSAPDLVEPGKTGEVFRHGHVDDLAAAIERVRRVRDSGAALAERCRARAAVNSLEAVGAALVRASRMTLAAVGRVGPARLIVPFQKSVMVAGNEKSLFEVFGLVAERGGVVHCLVNRWDSARIRKGIEEAGATWSYSRHWYPIRRRRMSPLQWLQMAWEVFKCSGDLLHAARSRRPTHLLAPDFVSLLLHWPAIAMLRLGGVRIVLKVANPPDGDPFYRFLWRTFVFPAVDVIVPNSQFTTAACVEAVGAPSAKIHWTYQPAPTHPLREDDRDWSKVLFVGQILPEKGIAVLLDAMERLLAKAVDVRLDVAGDVSIWLPPDLDRFRADLLARTERPPLAGRVRFLGWQEDVTTLLARAAIHCAPSMPEQREAMGRVLLEAKATGTPSVVFSTGAMTEMVQHAVNGWVCPEPTSEALAEGLEWYLHRPDRVAVHGAAAHADVARFSRERWAEVWTDVLALGPEQAARAPRPAYS